MRVRSALGRGFMVSVGNLMGARKSMGRARLQVYAEPVFLRHSVSLVKRRTFP
jgi:hypothetical protein